MSHGPSDVASMRLTRSRVTDGEWHHLLVELKSAKEGKDIQYLAVLTLDYGVDQVGWPGPSGSAGNPLTLPRTGTPQGLVDLGAPIVSPLSLGLTSCLMARSLPRWPAPGVRTRASPVCPSWRRCCLQRGS